MAAPLNPLLVNALDPPIMEAAGWVRAATFPANRPLINMAQAVPTAPPPAVLREAIAEASLHDDDAHLYGPVLGDDPLRAALAADIASVYGGEVGEEHVAITSGCNQAFCAAVTSLAGPGDEVILPTPWYFNHKMWLDMAGAKAVPLPSGESCLPDPEAAAALITGRTRAIVLVTPNNPTGAEYPPALMAAFHDLCAAHDLALIVDETYRDYLSEDRAPHGLFRRADWGDRLIHLYSFSKIFRLTGHRVGALVTGPERLKQVEKFLDTVTICASRLGQVAALRGLERLGDHRAEERRTFLDRRRALEAEFAKGAGGWRLLSAGAFFAYVAHPFDLASPEVAKALVRERSLLTLPGTFFAPTRAEGGDGMAERTCRIAFANVAEDGIAEMAERLRGFAP